jgi:hypothetical protein
MAEMTVVCCIRCSKDVALVDEHGRCEQCHIGAEKWACGPLTDLEELVKDWLDWGLTPSQLREALEMSLLDTEGPLTGTLLTRESGGTCCGDERCEARSAGMWDGPTSLFDDRDASGLSALARKFAHVSRREGSGSERGGLGVGLGQEFVEVLAGEFPLEGRGDLLVASTEGE